jgi:hypothetical protein
VRRCALWEAIEPLHERLIACSRRPMCHEYIVARLRYGGGGTTAEDGDSTERAELRHIMTTNEDHSVFMATWNSLSCRVSH